MYAHNRLMVKLQWKSVPAHDAESLMLTSTDMSSDRLNVGLKSTTHDI